MTNPIKIEGDYVVHAADELVFSGFDHGFQFVEYFPDDAPSLVNRGSVLIVNANDAAVVYGVTDIGDEASLYQNGVLIWNQAGASYTVEVTGERGGATASSVPSAM